MSHANLWGASWTDQGNVMTTELNNISSNNFTNPGTAFDNSVALVKYGLLEANITIPGGAGAGPVVWFYFLIAPDGSTYTSGGVAFDPGWQAIATHIKFIPTITTVQKRFSRPFMMYPCLTKFVCLNQVNSNFNATGNTVRLYTTREVVN